MPLGVAVPVAKYKDFSRTTALNKSMSGTCCGPNYMARLTKRFHN